ncbi:cupredoxin domain-containing protein [Paenibacillus alginolyticus]|uniref:Cupredoxin domain-containing protein n=1 Tax=Paenibacillus alginolyticus TaxID=59839 RepID=A0ABT4G9Y6_9BACL|nr:cupredoxin domain-containing protein [Paenibacillus alginolyticus]MCY9692949.1 cupredoxin domain-containing protein [Paenibacillus alginolyticus]MEC0144621.1 cupredoxin domain-containing protein [Paenibacillus alginolyticus]
MKVKKMGLLGSMLALVLIAAACGNTKSSTSSPSPSAQSTSAVSTNSGEEVSVTASNWKWELSKTTFKKGEQVTFVIKGKEGMHGFSIDGTKINENIGAGDTKKVTWVPDKAGEYTIKCSVMCGTGHASMIQKITVN